MELPRLSENMPFARSRVVPIDGFGHNAGVAERITSVPTLIDQFAAVRSLSLALSAPLSDGDATAQSMPDASPAKWHLAHTTWFFETFVLRDFLPGYRAYDDRFGFLFNSYYDAEGERHARDKRGLLTRPLIDEVRAYRDHVDAAIIDAYPILPSKARVLLELGCQHEQQHQELLLTDVLHLFAANPLMPALFAPAEPAPQKANPLSWIEGRTGVVEIGSDGESFAFDCEGPRHSTFLSPHALASRPVSNSEWANFILDGGYDDPRFWLSEGWAWVRANNIDAPLYWQRGFDGGWLQFSLTGLHRVAPNAPVSHISFFEADAYARWVGARLPTEREWESAAAKYAPLDGNLLDRAGIIAPRGAHNSISELQQLFGDVWEWTGSAYRPYPGFAPAASAVGEYNGKFMSSQFVLRGGSCATPRGHVRASYRNFFQPHQRWQFSGVRLAKDLG